MAEETDYSELTSCGGARGPIQGVKVYDGGRSYETIRLSDLPGAEITEVEDPETGEPRRGLFIPFRLSGLTVTPKRNVLLVCRRELAQLPSAKFTHLLTQVMDRDVEDELRRLGFRPGYIGHGRPADWKGKKRQ